MLFNRYQRAINKTSIDGIAKNESPYIQHITKIHIAITKHSLFMSKIYIL